MKLRHLITFCALFLAGGVMCLYLFMRIPSDPDNAQLLNYSYFRLIVAAGILLILLAVLILSIRLYRQPIWTLHLCGRLDCFFQENKGFLPGLQTGLFVGLVFLVELYFLTYISLPALLRQLITWAAVIIVQTWLMVRIVYSKAFADQLSLTRKFRQKWALFSSVQRKTFLLLAGIGFVYFCVFIPLNAKGWNGPTKLFYSGIDEVVQYSSPIRALTPGDNFSSSVYRFWIDEGSIYGHPYVMLSSIILLLPRLVFGVDFGSQVQINMLLMRQFLNVLPVILSMFFLVYIVTGFKSIKMSASIFVFLLLIPGVVKFNIRFLHPDGLILLLVVLTIYFLQKDSLKFQKNFYFGAITCGLTIAIKLWGFFFFLVIAIYLITGLIKKILTIKSMVASGLGFIFVMSLTILISNPGLLVPSVSKTMVSGLQTAISARGVGYTDDVRGEGVYEKGLLNWMRYFELYFIRDYYFYFCFLSLIAGSFWGTGKNISRIVLGWCIVTAIYLVYFVAVKSYWYMLPLMVPLYVSPFLLPGVLHVDKTSLLYTHFSKPLSKSILWGGMWLFCGSQFVVNIIMIITSPVILVYAR